MHVQCTSVVVFCIDDEKGFIMTFYYFVVIHYHNDIMGGIKSKKGYLNLGISLAEFRDRG